MANDVVRLMLSSTERGMLPLVKQVQEMELQGLSIATMAHKLGRTAGGLRHFLRSGTFKRCVEYLAQIEPTLREMTAEELLKKSREEFVQLAPDTLDYYRDCFKRHPEKEQPKLGLWVDDDKAQWAATQVSKGLGLTEPEHAARPIIQINLQHIQYEMNQVGEEDARARAALDVTPTDDR